MKQVASDKYLINS